MNGTRDRMDEHRRLRWRCRRGLLELDCILIPFFDDYFVTLSRAEQQSFARLLELPDQELLACLQKQQPAPDKDLKNIIERLYN